MILTYFDRAQIYTGLSHGALAIRPGPGLRSSKLGFGAPRKKFETVHMAFLRPLTFLQVSSTWRDAWRDAWRSSLVTAMKIELARKGADSEAWEEEEKEEEDDDDDSDDSDDDDDDDDDDDADADANANADGGQ